MTSFGILHEQPLAPSNQVARFRASEVNKSAERWWENQASKPKLEKLFSFLLISLFFGHPIANAEDENPLDTVVGLDLNSM